MRFPLYIPKLRPLLAVLLPAGLLALVTFVVWPATAARWPAAHGPAVEPPAPRLPSSADLALAGPAETVPPRDRLVAIENVNTGEKAVFNIGPGGYVRSDQTTALEHFLRCRRTKRKNPIHPTVLVLLADIAERWPGRVIEIISGFRAPPFGVPHSRHFSGHAIDLRVRGVPTAEVRDWVWREHQGVGVGHYPEGDFIHVDSRNDAREAAWSANTESARPNYNPGWARKARRTGLN